MAGSYTLLNDRIELSAPVLWSPDHSYLYTLTIHLLEIDKGVGSEQQNIIVCEFPIDGETRFVLNGEPLYLKVTYRHQEYRYIGYTLFDNALLCIKFLDR